MVFKEKTYLSILSLFRILVFSTLFINFYNLIFYIHKVKKRDLSPKMIKLNSIDSYREVECYQNIYRGLYTKNQVVKGHESINKFIVALDIDSHVIDTKFQVRSNNTLNKRELGDLLKIFYFNQAFLADVRLLNETEFVDSSINKKRKLSNHSIYKTKTFKRIDSYLNNDSYETVLLLTFGMKYENIKKLKNFENDLTSNLNPHCYFRKESVKNEQLTRIKKILAGFYIYCSKLVIHIPIFYSRGNFLWVSNDNLEANLSRVFGDKPRSMNK
jgi:hypothetical protein